jgi:hypothetical protein
MAIWGIEQRERLESIRNVRFPHRFWTRAPRGLVQKRWELLFHSFEYISVTMPAKKAIYFKWTVAKEEHFLDCLVNAVKAGQRTDTGWKPQVTADVITSFANNHHSDITRAQLENKRDNVRI